MKKNKRGYYNTGYSKYMTIEEFKKIKNWVNTRLKSPSMKLCFKCMMYLGLRKGDAIRLKREWFSLDWKILNIPETEKTGKPLELYVSKFLRKELKVFYRDYHKHMREGYLFFTSYYNDSQNLYLRKNSIDIRFSQMRKDLGFTQKYYTTQNGIGLHRITPHTLRHFVAWRIYEAGGKDRKAAQEWLGHSRGEITDGYINAMQSAQNREEIGEKAFVF